MKRTITALILAAAVASGNAALADPGEGAKQTWKGQVESEFVREDTAFHVLADDQAAWERVWRIRLDRKPPRPLGDDETGVVLVGGPRPTPGYGVRFEVTERTAGGVTLSARVISPDVVMFPTGADSHPYLVAVFAGNPLDVEVTWRE